MSEYRDILTAIVRAKRAKEEATTTAERRAAERALREAEQRLDEYRKREREEYQS